MRVLVAGWAGSTNLGDELVLAGMLDLLRTAGHTPVVLSVDPAGTRAAHGTEAVPGSTPRHLLTASRDADALVLGGGGLLQDETGPLNLPFHLARVWAARGRRRPVVGIGLGAGRLDTPLGRQLVRQSLRGVPLSVRDAPSAELLRGLGLPAPVLAADLAVRLPDVDVPAQDRVVVSLRPWTAGRNRLSARARARQPPPEALLRGTAAALDGVHRGHGLAVHLVALQSDRDGPLHDAVADRMTTPVTTTRPDLAALPAELGSGRAVIATRYHGGIGALLAGRPAVLIGYSPKVDALAADMGPAGHLLPWRPGGPAGLVEALTQVLGRDDAQRAARAALRRRERGNAQLLDRLQE